MAVLCGMPTIYSIRLEELGISALAAYFRHSTRPSVTWLNSRSSLAACDPLMSALSAVPSTRVRRRRKFGDVSCTECRPTGQGNDSELIPTVKMETSYGNEFSPIYDHCGVMAAWSRKRLKNSIFLRFWKNDPLRENCQNSVPKWFITTPIDVLCSNFVKFDRQEIGKIVRRLLGTGL